MSKPNPVADLLNAAAARLSAAGIDTPRNDARLLLAAAFGIEVRDVDKAVLLGAELHTMPYRAASYGESRVQVASQDSVPQHSFEATQCVDDDHALQQFQSMVAHRASRQPLQYITGHAPFRYLDLQVGPGVFIPRPETETVVQASLDWLSGQHLAAPRLVDLCAGSGAIGLSLVTEVPSSEVWAVEMSAQALAWTKLNRDTVLRSAGGGKRYHLVQGDATDAATLHDLDGTIDAVVSNPPYVPQSKIPSQPEVRDHDPSMALYGGSDDGVRIPEQVILRSATLLRKGGLLVMEHDTSQARALVDFALNHGFIGAQTGVDLTGRARYLIARIPD